MKTSRMIIQHTLNIKWSPERMSYLKMNRMPSSANEIPNMNESAYADIITYLDIYDNGSLCAQWTLNVGHKAHSPSIFLLNATREMEVLFWPNNNSQHIMKYFAFQASSFVHRTQTICVMGIHVQCSII